MGAVLFHVIELSCASEFKKVVFTGIFLGLNSKRKVLCLNFKVDV